MVEGHYYTIFPVGASVLALPFVVAAGLAFEYLLPLLPFLENYVRGRTVDELEELNSITVHKGAESLREIRSVTMML